MNRRRHSLVGRTAEVLRAAVRTAVERLRALRESRGLRRLRGADRERPVDDAIVLESGGNADAAARVPSATLVDPDDGPTSRSEILEYGVSPARYVRAVVADRGGRMKQRRFVDEYGWSPSTASRLLSDLEERGAIRRYRVGQEKVVCVPGRGPESAPRSPDAVEGRSRTEASARQLR